MHTLDNIKWAEDNGYIPVIRWGPGRTDVNLNRSGAQEATDRGDPKYVGNDPNFVKKEDELEPCLYYSEDGWNGSKNAWEYYFEPLNNKTVEDALQSECKISDIFQVGFHDLNISSLEEKFLIFNLHSYTPLNTWLFFYKEPEELYKHRRNVNEYVRKNVKVKEEIIKKVDLFYKKYFTEYMIGVHVRGTDKKSESYIGQRPFVILEDYITQIDLVLKREPNATIFIASDSNEAIKEIINRFPKNNIVVNKCTRMQKYLGPIPLHLSSFAGPLAGEEALIDCLLLSKCDHVICTDSNLSAAALYFNPETSCTFVNQHIGKK